MTETTPAPPALPLAAARRRVFWIVYTTVLIIQALHFVEHIAQVIQYYFLGVPRAHAHGIVGQLDLEVVHFIFDLWLIGSLVLVAFLGFKFVRRCGTLCTAAFTALLVVQGYHTVEHVVKFTQHLVTGAQGTPGIFGSFFIHALWFHFWLNFVVLALIAVTYGDLFIHRRHPADE